MSHNFSFKSPAQAVVMGSPLEFFDFVPLRGPGGGRVVVDKYIAVITGVITVATTLWDGRDVVRLFQQISVEQRDGKLRWSLSGMKSRHASIYYNGIEEHEEHANVAIGAGQAIDLRLIIPMAKQKVRRGLDFAMPADIFKKITLNMNSLAGAATSTTVLSAPTLSCYILAVYHEEFNVEFKAEDVIKSVDFTSQTQARFSLNGVVHDLFVLKEDTTAGGGASLAAITDARIEDLGTPTLTRQDLVHDYKVKRKLTASGPTTPGTQRYLEPVLEGKCLPVLASDQQTSLWDGRVLDSMKLDLGVGVTLCSAVTREVTEKSQANFNAQVGRFSINEKTLRMKTEGKTRRGLNDGWTMREKMVGVWSAPLPKVA